jgi:hypothetical protein
VRGSPRRLRALVVAGASLLAAGCGGATSPSLAAPTLTSPADFVLLDNGCQDRSNPLTWDFTWSDVPGATSYHLYVKQDAATLPVIDQKGIEVPTYRLSDNSFTFALTGWHWYVQAEANGTEGPPSRMGTFDVEPVDTDCK